MNTQKLVAALVAAMDADPRTDYRIAKEMGIDQENIRAIRRGTCPRVERLDKLLSVLGLTLTLGRPRSRKRVRANADD